jgi:hypothetical protein
VVYRRKPWILFSQKLQWMVNFYNKAFVDLQIVLGSGTLLLRAKERKEIALLLWMACANIPPNALDSPHWKTVQRECGLSLSEISTIWSRLPILVKAIEGHIEATLAKLRSFVTMLDLWTLPTGQHFLLLDVCGIIPDDTFCFWTASLDLIPFYSAAFSSTIAAAVTRVIQFHTRDCPDVIHAGNISDQGSNVHLAGAQLTDTNDQMACFNHQLKNVMDDSLGDGPMSCGGAKVASKDLIGAVAITNEIRTHRVLAAAFEEITPLKLLSINKTRWEGRYHCVKRVNRVRPAIRTIVRNHVSVFNELAENLSASKPANFLHKPFFDRLGQLEQFLQVFHRISKKSQDGGGATGSRVIKWTHKLLAHCNDTEDDPVWLSELKTATRDSLKLRIGHYLTSPSNYLKAALFHPRYSSRMEEFKVPKEVVERAWQEVWLC